MTVSLFSLVPSAQDIGHLPNYPLGAVQGELCTDWRTSD